MRVGKELGTILCGATWRIAWGVPVMEGKRRTWIPVRRPQIKRMAVSGREYKLEARIGVACGVGLAGFDAKQPPQSGLLGWRRWAGEAGGRRKGGNSARLPGRRRLGAESAAGGGPTWLVQHPPAPSPLSGEVPNGCPRGSLGAGRARARAHGELAHGWAGLSPAPPPPPPPPPPSRRRCGRRARRRPRGDGAGLLG